MLYLLLLSVSTLATEVLAITFVEKSALPTTVYGTNFGSTCNNRLGPEEIFGNEDSQSQYSYGVCNNKFIWDGKAGYTSRTNPNFFQPRLYTPDLNPKLNAIFFDNEDTWKVFFNNPDNDGAWIIVATCTVGANEANNDITDCTNWVDTRATTTPVVTPSFSLECSENCDSEPVDYCPGEDDCNYETPQSLCLSGFYAIVGDQTYNGDGSYYFVETVTDQFGDHGVWKNPVNGYYIYFDTSGPPVFWQWEIYKNYPVSDKKLYWRCRRVPGAASDTPVTCASSYTYDNAVYSAVWKFKPGGDVVYGTESITIGECISESAAAGLLSSDNNKQREQILIVTLVILSIIILVLIVVLGVLVLRITHPTYHKRTLSPLVPSRSDEHETVAIVGVDDSLNENARLTKGDAL